MQLSLVVNFLIFQLGWLVAVVGAAWGYPLAGVAYAATWALLHHWRLGDGRVPEIRFVVAAATLGYMVDSALVLGGAFAFPDYARLGYPTTIWMVSLWLMFSMTLRHSLGWLRNQYVLAAALGAVFGPVAYWAGAQLGAIELTGGAAAVASVALAWALSMMILLRLEILTRTAPGCNRVTV